MYYYIWYCITLFFLVVQICVYFDDLLYFELNIHNIKKTCATIAPWRSSVHGSSSFAPSPPCRLRCHPVTAALSHMLPALPLVCPLNHLAGPAENKAARPLWTGRLDSPSLGRPSIYYVTCRLTRRGVRRWLERGQTTPLVLGSLPVIYPLVSRSNWPVSRRFHPPFFCPHLSTSCV